MKRIKPVMLGLVMQDVSELQWRVPIGQRLQGLVALVLLSLAPGSVPGAGEVTAIEARDSAATPIRYTVGNTTLQWGQGNNRLLDAFVADGRRFTSIRSADRVEIRRVDRPTIATGSPCGVFAESADGSQVNMAPDLPAPTGSGARCDMTATLAGRVVNRGALDLFSNRPPTAKNIERVDFLFDTAANAPFDTTSMTVAGHLVGDKSGNNPVQVAAILGLDDRGLPDAYGPLVPIDVAGCVDPVLCYGVVSDIRHYAFLQTGSIAPQGAPVPFTNFSERAAFAFVSAESLGLSPAQRYHGLSLFPEDVDVDVHDLLDPSTFPDDTEDADRSPGDSVDVFGGSADLYLADTTSIVDGRVTCDASDGVDNSSIAGATIRLHVDGNENGVLDDAERSFLGEPAISDTDGTFDLIGLASGSYLLTLEDPEPAQSAETPLASTNPVPFVIAGSDAIALEAVIDCRDPAREPTDTPDIDDPLLDDPDNPPSDDESGAAGCVPGGAIDGCLIATEVDGHGFGRLGETSLMVLLLWSGGRMLRRRPMSGR